MRSLRFKGDVLKARHEGGLIPPPNLPAALQRKELAKNLSSVRVGTKLSGRYRDDISDESAHFSFDASLPSRERGIGVALTHTLQDEGLSELVLDQYKW